jgi:hypothetical protein
MVFAASLTQRDKRQARGHGGMEIFLIVFIALLVGAVITGISKAQANAKVAATTKDRLSAIYNFDELFVSSFDGTFIGICFDQTLIVVGKNETEKTYGFSQIAEVTVLRDGSTISNTNRGSQLAGMAVGGLALGGLGALVGGVTGSSRTSETIKSLKIKIRVDDREEPLHQVTFFKMDAGKGVKPDSVLIQHIVPTMDNIHAHLLNAMRNAVQLPAELPAKDSANSTEQISQLWQLHQSGALSVDEFNQQKARLLER